MPNALLKTGNSQTAHGVDTSYVWGSAAHEFHVYDQASVDLLLVHQAKMVGAALKTATRAQAWTIDPVPRAAKDRVLRGP